MICKECSVRLYVSESREKDNIRFRIYTCKECYSLMYTTESENDINPEIFEELMMKLKSEEGRRGRPKKERKVNES